MDKRFCRITDNSSWNICWNGDQETLGGNKVDLSRHEWMITWNHAGEMDEWGDIIAALDKYWSDRSVAELMMMMMILKLLS